MDSNIDDLISKLRTTAGKAVATAKALERGLTVGDEHRSKTIDYSMSIGDYDIALKLCRSTSEAERIMAKYSSLKRKGFEGQVKLFFASKLIALDYFGMSFQQRGIEVARKELKLAEKAETEGRVRVARNRYRDAITFLMFGAAYVEAYQLAISQGFNDLAKEAYTKGISVLEKFGRFGECARLAEVTGHPSKTQIYRNLDTLLNAA